METISYSDLRGMLKMKFDETAEKHEPLIITRQNGKDMVIMSLEDYNSFIETIYLLSSPNNVAHLSKSIQQVEDGLIKSFTIDELKSFEK